MGGSHLQVFLDTTMGLCRAREHERAPLRLDISGDEVDHFSCDAMKLTFLAW